VLTQVVPRDLVGEVLAETRRREKRSRLLPAHVVVYFVMAMAIFRGAWLGHRRLMAIDGVKLDVPDTAAHLAWAGRPGGLGRRPFPQVQVLGLGECGTHAVVAAQIGALSVGERELAAGLLEAMGPGMLVIADRGFFSFEFWRDCLLTGADLLFRVPAGLKLPVLQALPPHPQRGVLGSTKSGRTRPVTLGSGTAEMIRRHVRAWAARAEPEGDWLFSPSPRQSGYMTAGALSRRLTRLGSASGVEHAALHRLRHGVATYLVDPGLLLKAQARLGHGDPATTLRHYSHAVPLDDTDVADQLDGLLNSLDLRHSQTPQRGLGRQLRFHSPCFPGPPSRLLFGDDGAVGEDLAAPDPVGFVSFDRAGQAGPAHRAGLAVFLGELKVGRLVREPQLRVLAVARQRVLQCLCPGHQQDQGAGHDLLPPGDRRGGVVAAGPHPAGTRTAATGDPVGVHDIRVARVQGQRLVPPAGRPAMALGPLDLFHARPPYR
jgi:hypothetical protein